MYTYNIIIYLNFTEIFKLSIYILFYNNNDVLDHLCYNSINTLS